MSQINEKSFEGAIAKLGEPDTFESWSLDSGNLRAFLAAFLQAEAARGFQMMPREPSLQMLKDSHALTFPLVGAIAVDGASIWRAMFDASGGGGHD